MCIRDSCLLENRDYVDKNIKNIITLEEFRKQALAFGESRNPSNVNSTESLSSSTDLKIETTFKDLEETLRTEITSRLEASKNALKAKISEASGNAVVGELTTRFNQENLSRVFNWNAPAETADELDRLATLMTKVDEDDQFVILNYERLLKDFQTYFLENVRQDLAVLADLQVEKFSDALAKLRKKKQSTEPNKPTIPPKSSSDPLILTENRRYSTKREKINALEFESVDSIPTAHNSNLFQIVKVDDGCMASNGADNNIVFTNYAANESVIVESNSVSSCVLKAGDYVMSGNNAHMIIFKYDKVAKKLNNYHRANFANGGFVRSIDEINVNEDKHVIVGFNGGIILLYNLDKKEKVTEFQSGHQSPRIDVFFCETPAELTYFSSAWFDKDYFTVNTYNKTTNAFAEVIKVQENFKVQRVRSVVIKGQKCVVYGGNMNVGIYNIETKQTVARSAVSNLGSCSALSLIGYNTDDFLILFYNKTELQFFKFENGALSFFCKLVDPNKLYGNFTNSCCLSITSISDDNCEIVLAKHDSADYKSMTRVKVKFTQLLNISIQDQLASRFAALFRYDSNYCSVLHLSLIHI
eukprot:TRINITY_DN7215_c0_g2_i1.p1 TRINITY_DN7215_c0_g2~~TRINITY_DN7215_c0_g2_i1.p1  ORF type:complete len:602 (-),score=186.49 TRINITY_DN7215_c0_g2_i1:66-1823(-)